MFSDIVRHEHDERYWYMHNNMHMHARVQVQWLVYSNEVIAFNIDTLYLIKFDKMVMEMEWKLIE